MAGFGPPKTLGALLREQAERRPDQIALYFENDEITWRELHRRSAALAAGLEGLGIRAGERVGLLAPNTPAFLDAWFGAAILGAVTVPINPVYTTSEIRFILENAEASAVIAADARREDLDKIAPSLPGLRCRITVDGRDADGWRSLDALVDAGLSARAGRGAPAPGAGPDVEDAAAIIYTSGTTGNPKGVVLTHHNYHFDAWSLSTHLQVSESDRFLCFLPLFHVNAQVVSVLTAVLSGGSLILLREFKPATFFEQVSRYRATTFSAVPTVYAILNTLPGTDEYDLSSLRYCVCGAAPMPVEVFTTFEQTFQATIVEGYGLSEATCGSCINPVGENDVRKIGSIGLPLPGQEMAILDDEGRELPDGEIGEIAMRGPMVMREYFRNPEATRAAVVDGWLRSGDLGRRDADGYYYVEGRKKELIIRGGQNIYPKEIEEVLYQHPAVLEAAVIGLTDSIWGEIVCACIVPREGEAPGEESIVALCREKLAPFKVPERVVFFESLPRTPTGKIQKGRIAIDGK